MTTVDLDENRAADRFGRDGGFGIGADPMSVRTGAGTDIACVLRVYDLHGACTWVLTREQAADLMGDLQRVLEAERWSICTRSRPGA